MLFNTVFKMTSVGNSSMSEGSWFQSVRPLQEKDFKPWDLTFGTEKQPLLLNRVLWERTLSSWGLSLSSV